MNLRLKTYTQLFPFLCALGFLYLITLGFFNRKEAYHSKLIQIGDRANVIQAFIESDLPVGIPELQLYLKQKLSNVFADLSDFALEIRNVDTGKTVFSWEKSDSENMPVFQYSDVATTETLVPGKKEGYEEIRPLQLNPDLGNLELVIITRQPILVLMDPGFWMEIGAGFLVLILLGTVSAEIIIFILNRGIISIQIRSGGLLAAPERSEAIERSSHIQEINELSNSITTLKDSYLAKISEREFLESEKISFVRRKDALAEVRTCSGSTREGHFGKYRFEMIVAKEIRAETLLSFVCENEGFIYGFFGVCYQTSEVFDPGVLEWIIQDIVKHSGADIGALKEKLSVLRLLSQWCIVILDPVLAKYQKTNSNESDGLVETGEWGGNHHQMILCNLFADRVFPVEFLDSDDWRSTIQHLINANPYGAILAIETINLQKVG